MTQEKIVTEDGISEKVPEYADKLLWTVKSPRKIPTIRGFRGKSQQVDIVSEVSIPCFTRDSVHSGLDI